MLKKYLDKKKAVVDEPSIWKITKNSIQVQRAGGTETIPYKDEFTIQIGNVEEPSIWKISSDSIKVKRNGSSEQLSFTGEFTIKVGNVESYNSTYIDPTETDTPGTNPDDPGQTPDTPSNPDNPSNPDIPDNPNNPDVPSNPSNPDDQGEQTTDNLGQLQYSVGLISDIHYCVTPNNRTLITNDTGNENNTSGYDSKFKEDLVYLIQNPFKNVDFIASPGDIATFDINDFIQFTQDYNNLTNKSFYCSLGNHDHLVTYGNKAQWLHWSGEVNNNTDGSRWYSIQQNNTIYPCPGSLAKNVPNNNRSNLSYYIVHNNDVYIFLSASYGDTETLNKSLEQSHPHNQLSANDPYVQQMISYCGKNTFVGNESNFNFQYYKPQDLIWLKNIIESNQNKRVFVFSHYFFPHKAGGGNKYVPGASTELMGITFHFLNALNNNNSNTIWFSGHSHISWQDTSVKGLHWTNKNYKYIEPTATDNSSILTNYTSNFYQVTTGNKPYNRLSDQLIDNNATGWNIHLPSMSRPAQQDGPSTCEAAIMEVYENGVKIKKLSYTTSDGISYVSKSSNIADDTLTIYNNGEYQNNDTAQEITESINTGLDDNQIKLIIRNDLNETVRFTGYLRLVLVGDVAETDFCFRDNRHYPSDGSAGWYMYSKGSVIDGYTHGANTEQLAPGQSLSITYSKRMESHSSSHVTPLSDISTLFGRYLTQTTNDLGMIKLSVAIDRSVDNPNRIDNYPSYYSLRFTDANGNVLTNNPQIISKGTYYLSIYDKRSLYNQNWSIIPYDRKSSDILDTAYVTVQ